MVATKLYEVTSKGTECFVKRRNSRNSTGDDTGSSPSPPSSGSSPGRYEILPTSTSAPRSAATATATDDSPLTPSPSRRGSSGNNNSSPSTGISASASAMSAATGNTPHHPSTRSSSSSWFSSLEYLTGSGVPEYDDEDNLISTPNIDNYSASPSPYYKNPLKLAAESTYALVASVVSSYLYTDSNSNNSHHGGSASNHLGGILSTLGGSSQQQPHQLTSEYGGCDDSTTRSGSKKSSSFTRHLNSNDLAMVLFQNPYNSVRGRRHSLHAASSLSAVRSLLTVLPQTQTNQSLPYQPRLPPIDTEGQENNMHPEKQAASPPWESPTPVKLDPYNTNVDDDDAAGGDVTETDDYERPFNHPYYRHPYSPNQMHAHNQSSSETASQIAEGTLRALRDLALDEAVELHWALRFWTERWERPLLSWLEAGPPGTPRDVILHILYVTEVA